MLVCLALISIAGIVLIIYEMYTIIIHGFGIIDVLVIITCIVLISVFPIYLNHCFDEYKYFRLQGYELTFSEFLKIREEDEVIEMFEKRYDNSDDILKRLKLKEK